MHCNASSFTVAECRPKPNPFVAERFGCSGSVLAGQIPHCGADVSSSDRATSRGPACGSIACRSSTGGKPIRTLQCLYVLSLVDSSPLL